MTFTEHTWYMKLMSLSGSLLTWLQGQVDVRWVFGVENKAAKKIDMAVSW